MDDRDLAATPAGTDGAGACPRCGAYKHTPRSPELKRDVTRRINRVVGQLGGIRAMVEEDATAATSSRSSLPWNLR